MRSTCTQSQLCTATPVSSFVQCQISFRLLPLSVTTFILIKILHRVNQFSVAAWTDTYGVHHWTILRNSYRNLAWVGFEPTTTESYSDALTDRVIRPWVQLALRPNFVQLIQFYLLLIVWFLFGFCLSIYACIDNT